jgi:hypothetical protein
MEHEFTKYKFDNSKLIAEIKKIFEE